MYNSTKISNINQNMCGQKLLHEQTHYCAVIAPYHRLLTDQHISWPVYGMNQLALTAHDNDQPTQLVGDQALQHSGFKLKLFRIVNFLLGRGKQAVYPKHTDSLCLASVFNNYFVTKIADIRKEFPDLERHAAQLSITDFDISFDLSSSRLSSFTPTTVSEV